MNRNLYNIHILGIGFMFVFSAFITAGFISAIVLKDFNSNGIDSKTGFYSLSIIYACLGLANWFSPAVVKKLGPELSLFLSSIPYTGFIYCMIEPYMWSVFTLSALLGFGGAVLWTACGEVISKNSPGDTKAKNTGIFWSWFNSSMLLGNVFLYFYLGDSAKISDTKRYVIYQVLGVLCTLGMFTFLLLAPVPDEPTKSEEDASIVPFFLIFTRKTCVSNDVERENAIEEKTEGKPQSVLQPIVDAARFCKTREMCLLYLPIIFTGVSLNYWSSVFITSVGNVFPNRSYLALGGISTGVGEIAAGFIWGRLTNKIGRHGVIIASTIINIFLFVLCFISFPSDAATTTAAVAEETPIIPSSIYLALGLGVLLGLGDGGFNVSIYAAVGTIFESNPAPAFAMFKFVQSSVGAAAFVYCGHLILPYQLGILTVTCVVGCISFAFLDKSPSRKLEEKAVADPEQDKFLQTPA
ncbi:UNC93-like protein MFSD11 [Bolinopsis microptera]|uniref:UNC93-like protein MFSD11 n=1 Tax=Bolinopsis microptera TaxID=2820187 RepID=UPI003079CA96